MEKEQQQEHEQEPRQEQEQELQEEQEPEQEQDPPHCNSGDTKKHPIPKTAVRFLLGGR